MIREALSASVDGEDPGVPSLLLARHLADCSGCTSFREDIGPGQTWARQPDVGLSLSILAAHRRAADHRPDRMLLRGTLAVTGLVELWLSLSVLLSHSAYRLADHADHESVSFALAIGIGLLVAAVRPRLAAAYLPVVGVAVALLATTALIDARAGRVRFGSEAPHLDLLAGFVALCLLARGRPVRRRGRQPVPQSGRSSAHVGPRRLRLVRRLALVPLLAGAAMLVAPSPASAHASLEQTSPGQDTTVQQPPTAVTLRFDEAVTTLPGAVRVYAPDGARADDGSVTHPGGVGAEVAVGLSHATASGTYLVSWRVISADSHPVSGAFTFSLRTSSRAAAVATTQNNDSVAVALAASRWLSYVGAALLLGGVAFLALCWRGGWVVARARRLVRVAVAVSAVAAVLGVLLKGPYDAGLGLSHVVQGDLLGEVLGTTYGHGLVARLVILALAAVWLLLRERLRRPSAVLVGVVLAIGFALSFSVTGHAVSGTQRPLALLADSVHLVSMSLWFGGLVMLLAVVLPRRDASESTAALVAFSPVATTCVLLLVATGTYQSWRQVGSWAAFPHTTYGRELLVKLVVVAVVLVIASASRRWVRRTLRSPLELQAATLTPAAAVATPEPDLRIVRRSVLLEAVLLVVVLGITSALVATDPARAAYQPSVSASLHVGPDVVQVSGVPDGVRRMSVHLTVLDKDHRLVDPPQVTAAVSLPSKGIGPLPVPLRRSGAGHRTALVAVPVAGSWQLQVTVRTTAIDEYTSSVRLPLR